MSGLINLNLKNSHIYKNGGLKPVSAKALQFSAETSSLAFVLNGIISDGAAQALNCYLLPAFCDVHVHFREPGFCYKETFESGGAAAARGGYSDVCTMPNLNPVPDGMPNLKLQLEAAKKSAVNIHPFGAITVGEQGEKLSDFEELAPFVVGFSDDGRGVQSEDTMLLAMKRAKALNKIISAHCEDNSLLCGGYIHKGKYAEEHGHKGISSESEWGQIERDLYLAEKTGCKYHVCHISTKESVDLIRKAKRRGVDVTCETAPHYLVLDDSDLKEEGRFKMNPPLRDKSDRYALLEGIADGTLDMIATDHAPHSAEEKSGGLEKSLMGVVGLETAFPILYTKLVKERVIGLEKLVYLMADAPRKRFGIPNGGYCLYNLEREYTINPQNFLSKGKSTPFEGEKVFGENMLTIVTNKNLEEI